jgi:uncharacterized protein
MPTAVSRHPDDRRPVNPWRSVGAVIAAGLIVSAVLAGCTLLEPSGAVLSGEAPSDGASVTWTAADRPAGLDAAGLDEFPAAIVTFDLTGDREASSIAPLTVRVLVADTPAARARGLQGVTTLAPGEGMLFLFPDTADGGLRAGFWMLDTLVPLDIAFARGGVVIGTATMVPCPSQPCPVTRPRDDYDAAVEVPAGWLAANGVGPGVTLRWHPIPD